MLSSAEPQPTMPFGSGVKNEVEEAAAVGSPPMSPKSSSFGSSSGASDEQNHHTNVSSSSPMNMQIESVPSTAATSTFSSQFSAANLFGLFENGFEKTPKVVDIPPTQNARNNGSDGSSANLLFANAFGNNNGTAAETVAATPIDQLLQISQQILSDGIAKQQQQHQRQLLSQQPGNMNGRRSKTAPNAENGGGAAGGKQHGEVSDRKRSYPYTFQFCVLCQKNVHSSKLPCHIRQCHVGKPMFQCPVCDFTSTYSKNNVKSHMVSLHGLAGDPISYMDQYAVQVEDFMKKCFPLVRGRGRPIHGRFSPSKQLKMSPTRTVASSGSGASAPTMLDLSPSSTASSNQQRRHSAAALFPGNGNGTQPAATPPRGRQRGGGQRAANNNGSGGDIGPMIGGQQTGSDFIGMLGAGGAVLPKSDVLEKFALPNGFTAMASATFNPFFYLQQLNNIFPNTGAFHNPLEMKQENHHAFKVDSEMTETAMPGPTPTTALLEECLNFSQKFLREMSAKDANAEEPSDATGGKEALLTCHSSSSTASPPSRSSVPAPSNPSNSAHHDFHVEEPRYFPQQLDVSVLEGSGLDKTVFGTFSGSNELIEKFDLSIFESLMKQQTSSLLTQSQRDKVAAVRSQLNLQLFEILFALHRLDTNVLKPAQVHLVEQIAPTNADIRRFHQFEQSNSVGVLDKNEQFVLELSKIERLKEKLAVMALMGEFDEETAKINQQLQCFSAASKLLFNSAQFHTLLHLLLTCLNLISGDFSAQLVKGFQPSRIIDLCAFRFPDGTTLSEVLRQIVHKQFPDVLAFINNSGKEIGKAANVEFSKLVEAIDSLERGKTMLEEEIRLSDSTNQQLADLHAHCTLEITQLRESLQNTKEQLLTTMEFFGDSRERGEQQFRPEELFGTISRFFDAIQAE